MSKKQNTGIMIPAEANMTITIIMEDTIPAIITIMTIQATTQKHAADNSLLEHMTNMNQAYKHTIRQTIADKLHFIQQKHTITKQGTMYMIFKTFQTFVCQGTDFYELQNTIFAFYH